MSADMTRAMLAALGLQYTVEAIGCATIESPLPSTPFATKFESGKAARPQSAPKLFFFPGLVTSKAARIGRGIHPRQNTSALAGKQSKHGAQRLVTQWA